MTLPSRSLSPSSVEAFARCPRLYEYRHVHRLISAGYAPALTIGKAIHAAGEQLRICGSLDGKELDRATEAASHVFGDWLLEPAASRDAAKVAIMVSCYWRRWYTGGVAPWTCLANELELRTPLHNPATGRASRTFQLHGFCDAVIRDDASDRLYLYEMKTTSDSIREVESWARESVQIPMYLEMLHLAGIDCDGAIVDVVKKPVLKPRKSKKNGAEPYAEYLRRCAEAYAAEPDRFFKRIELPNDEAQRRDAMAQCWRVAEAIRCSDREGYLAVRGPRCSFSYGWCRYKDICWYASLDGYEHEERHDDRRDSTGNKGRGGAPSAGADRRAA